MSENASLHYGFIGSGSFAASCLRHLASWRPPSFIATAPPRAAGRGGSLTPTRVGAFAAEYAELAGVPVFETARASDDERVFGPLRGAGVDLVFVIDFGQVITEPLLCYDMQIGCLNIHPSLLPLYRGAAPVQRAIMDCADITGVTIFKLAAGMDSGPVLLSRELAVGDDDTGALLERAAGVGARAFIELADSVPATEWRFTPQDDAAATEAPKITREEERIDWSCPAREVLGRIRALAPKPGAWTTIGGKRLRVLGAELASGGAGTPGTMTFGGPLPVAAAGDGALALTLVQPEGKKIQSAADWQNGLRRASEVCLV